MYIFPENNFLLQRLSEIFNKNTEEIKIISRSNFIESSTFPVEIVECEVKNDGNYNLLCKYQAGMGPNNFGHRGGVEYEGKVYENIIDKSALSKVKYFGQYISNNGDLALVLEYLGEKKRMLYSDDENAMFKAAKWIGSFHNEFENVSIDYITNYNKDYYSIWLDRFKRLIAESINEYPWLTGLMNFYHENIDGLIKTNRTIIHGEYYPRNILLKDGIIYVIDWESTAYSAGEIDLASLIEGWGEDIAEKVKQEYKKVRWPDNNFSEEEFEKRLLIAQIYFHFWWWEEKTESQKIKETESFEELLCLYKQCERFFKK